MAKEVKRISAGQLDSALKEILETYATDVLNCVNVESEKAAQQLVKITKATAPVGTRRKKHYKRYITYSEDPSFRGKFVGKTYIWHVKSPEYRLTHLLINGHATRNGGRTKANPFLHNAVDTVAETYERKVVEAIKNGG